MTDIGPTETDGNCPAEPAVLTGSVTDLVDEDELLAPLGDLWGDRG